MHAFTCAPLRQPQHDNIQSGSPYSRHKAGMASLLPPEVICLFSLSPLQK